MPARPRSASLTSATVAAATLTAIALALRITVAVPGGPTDLERFVPELLGAAGLCAAGLTIRRAPAVAWLSVVAAAGIGGLEILGIVRTWQAFAPPSAWPWLVALAGVALAAAAVIGALQAIHPRPAFGGAPRRLVRLGALVGLGALIGLEIWALVTANGHVSPGAGVPDPWPIRWTGRVALALVLIGALTGAIIDLVPPIGRARRRLGSRSDETVPRRLSAFAGLLADELVPWLSARGGRASDEERARLAADLHARVLPDLRRAAAAAAQPGVPASVAAGVRGALAEVEQLMEGRESVVLESYGLVAALEWLAERSEERSPLRVAVDLDGQRVADPDAVPVDVARALFRIALLALDNVERHAAAGHVSIRLSVDPGLVRLEIRDDGRGLDRVDGEVPARPGRGLPDMRAEAAAVGASLTISAGPGTTVDVAWRTAGLPGEHATLGADSPARPLLVDE